jgi:hypothetical protein
MGSASANDATEEPTAGEGDAGDAAGDAAEGDVEGVKEADGVKGDAEEDVEEDMEDTALPESMSVADITSVRSASTGSAEENVDVEDASGCERVFLADLFTLFSL